MPQDLLTVQKLSQSFYLKKAFKFLLSLSIFSLCLSYHSWILFFLRYSTLFHSNKNYMFLVCNGILVFLARNSDFVSSPFKDTTDNILEDDDDEMNIENLELDHHQDIIQPECSEMKYDLEEKEKELDVQLLMTQGHDHSEEEEEEEEEVQLLMTQDHDHYEEEEEEEEEDYEANGLLSGDELKKKFDDFIKKVKQQIRIEAYQLQLHAY